MLTAPYLALPTEGQQEQLFHLPEAAPKASSSEFLALKLSPAHAARINPILRGPTDAVGRWRTHLDSDSETGRPNLINGWCGNRPADYCAPLGGMVQACHGWQQDT